MDRSNSEPATTTAAVGVVPDPLSWQASLVCGAATAVGLHYVVIILAEVLGRKAAAEYSSRAHRGNF